MLWTIFVVLVILWLLGMVTSYAPRPLYVSQNRIRSGGRSFRRPL
jgi:Family of unknown function (DUF5670)